MTKSINSNLIVFGIPLFFICAIILFINSPFFQTAPEKLATAVTLDLTISIPFIYFLLIRKKAIPKITVASVFIICVIIAGFIIPIEHHFLLNIIKNIAIPFAELSIITFLFLKARLILKIYKKDKNQAIDFHDALTLACTTALPSRIGKLLVTEISVIYYAFFCNHKRVLTTNEYTYFKKSGIKSVIGALIFILLIESSAVHLIAHQWSPMLAWVLTFFSLYACIQIFALLRSMNHRLITIDETNRLLHLRYGFFNQTTIPFRQIEAIELNRRTLPENKSVLQFSPLGGFDHHNIIIQVAAPHTLQKIYGIKKKYKKIAIYVDEKNDFVNRVKEFIQIENKDSSFTIK